MYKTISEGTLLATAKKTKADEIVSALRAEGIPASVAGEVVSQRNGIRVFEGNKKRRLEHPKIDPFWAKFEEYLKKR
jgi:hydrogenase maturation factor